MRSGRGAVLLLAGLATVACSGGRDLAGKWVVEKLLAPQGREMTSTQAAAPAKAPPPPPAAQHRESHVSDPVLLFRYSTLTFNGHRIHYDRDYVTKVEGYPGLIFHGPLQASFIVELAAKLRGGRPPKQLTYRGVQPLFEASEFSINANDKDGGMELWTANAEGQPTMKGTATC